MIGEGTSKIILCGHRTSWTNSNQAWESFISWHKVFNLYILGGVHVSISISLGGGGGHQKDENKISCRGGGGG